MPSPMTKTYTVTLSNYVLDQIDKLNPWEYSLRNIGQMWPNEVQVGTAVLTIDFTPETHAARIKLLEESLQKARAEAYKKLSEMEQAIENLKALPFTSTEPEPQVRLDLPVARQRFYVTYAISSWQANNYSVVEAEDLNAARQHVFEVCGREGFASLYTLTEFDHSFFPAGEIPLTRQTKKYED